MMAGDREVRMARPDERATRPTVSDAELEVLKELWGRGGMTPSDLHLALADRDGAWAYTTVQTFLHRLHGKRFVTRRRDGRTWVYESLLTRDEVLHQQIEREVRRVGASPRSTFLLGLLDGASLRRRDIERLRRMLDQAEAALESKPTGGDGEP